MKRLFAIALCLLLLSGCAATYDGPTETVLVLDFTSSTHYWSDGSLMDERRTEYAYDVYGNVAQTIDYSNDEAVSKTVNRYDENGNLLRSDDYGRLSGWLPKRTHRAEYTYDEQGRILSYSSDNTTDIFSYTAEYDDEANTQTIHYGEGHFTVNYYDGSGYLMRTETTDPDGTFYLDEYTRRPDGLPLTHRSWINGEETGVILYEYDDQGRKILQNHYEGGVLTATFRWEYFDKELEVCMYRDDGGYILTGYYEGDRIRVRQSWDADGQLEYEIYYRYREIRVPAETEGTP